MDNLYNFWYKNESNWFGAPQEFDNLVTEKFGELITDNPNIEEIKLKDKISVLEHILLYDQIIRHVYRGNENKIKLLSVYSLNLSLYLIENNLDLEYSDKERVFILMPLRHTFNLEYMTIAFERIKMYRETNPESKYYIKFYKATILSISKIKTPLIVPEEVNELITDEEIFKTLDPDCIKNLSTINCINKSEPIYDAFKITLTRLRDIKEITISLSGGVDSMISSFNLYHLSNMQQKFKIIAVTIDYGNREDNKYEVEFVKRWCKLLGITHYVKHITELKRNKSMDRDLYEKVTRTMRFDMYKHFGNPVILGHNIGDCIENIINNIKKTRSINNLRGMSKINEEAGCLIIRPMLDISKKDIKEFAKKYNIPHLPNSTPSWSERGKIRDELIPFINNFDPSIIPGLIKLADNMKEIYDICDKTVVDRFYNSIKFNDNNVYIDFNYNAPEKECGFIFWKNIIARIIKKLNLQLPSNKSIKTFTERISNNHYGIIKLTNKIEFNYTNKSLILIIK
jgi:tRNA(Ile)-lysidine synthetase-like protein